MNEFIQMPTQPAPQKDSGGRSVVTLYFSEVGMTCISFQ